MAEDGNQPWSPPESKPEWKPIPSKKLPLQKPEPSEDKKDE